MDAPTVHALAGSIAGLTAAVLVCPLDVVKIRLQNQGPQGSQRYSGIKGTIKTVLREEGIRGLYRGLGATSLAYIIDRAIWFPLYDQSKIMFAGQTGKDTTVTHLSAVVLASSICLLVTSPLWVLRTRVMSQDQFHYSGIWNGLTTMVRSEGWNSLYKGIGPSFLGLTHVTVQFPLYEQLKIRIREWQIRNSKDTQGDIGTLGLLTASALSKFIATIATYPHEVLRTRLQTQQSNTNGNATTELPKYRGIIQTANVILKEEGWQGLYKGLGTNLLRTVPAAAFSLCVYEILVRNMGSHT